MKEHPDNTLDHNSPIPLYVQIQEYLRTNIRAGNFAINTRLPSERQLAEQFGVNRLTVAKALGELAHEGLIETRIGKGTYVRSPRIDQELKSLTSFTQDMSTMGVVSSIVLAETIEPATEKAAAALKIETGALLFSLKRVRLVDETSIALEHTRIPLSLCPDILKRHNFAQESLYAVLRNGYDLRLASAKQTIEARAATLAEAEALEIMIGQPILGITRVTYDDLMRPVEYVLSAYRGDRYTFHISLQGV